MLVVIRGAGDIATGIALRLWRAGMQVVMTDIPAPTAIRRTVCFSQAVVHGEAEVEGVQARRAEGPEQAAELLKEGVIPVLADPEGSCIPVLKPDAVVDAILAKKNLGTKITDAPVVVGVGPGFTAGVDCHAVVETMRGHTLGRVYHQGSALPNTGIPGLIGGFAGERVLRAPADGVFHQLLDIGAQVKMGDVAATVDGEPMICTLDGVLRGILPEGTPVHKGMKAGDIDPRCAVEHCYTASDKALAVGGGVLFFTAFSPFLRPVWDFWVDTLAFLLHLTAIPLRGAENLCKKIGRWGKNLFYFIRKCYTIKNTKHGRRLYKGGGRHGKSRTAAKEAVQRKRPHQASDPGDSGGDRTAAAQPPQPGAGRPGPAGRPDGPGPGPGAGKRRPGRGHRRGRHRG